MLVVACLLGLSAACPGNRRLLPLLASRSGAAVAAGVKTDGALVARSRPRLAAAVHEPGRSSRTSGRPFRVSRLSSTTAFFCRSRARNASSPWPIAPPASCGSVPRRARRHVALRPVQVRCAARPRRSAARRRRSTPASTRMASSARVPSGAGRYRSPDAASSRSAAALRCRHFAARDSRQRLEQRAVRLQVGELGRVRNRHARSPAVDDLSTSSSIFTGVPSSA